MLIIEKEEGEAKAPNHPGSTEQDAQNRLTAAMYPAHTQTSNW